MTDSTGTIKARYDYDPWGNRTKLSGSVDADFGFTGHYYHAPSNLHLTPFRAYDSASGRWLSRDPIGEAGSINLYGYVGNRVVTQVDPIGLEVAARYSIAEQWLTAVDLERRLAVTGAFSSGDNTAKDAAQKLGPIPPGMYGIYFRQPSRFAASEFVLDPIDSRTGNDYWDGGTGRGAFRIHIEFPTVERRGSDGCLVANERVLNNLGDLLNRTVPGPFKEIISSNRGRAPDNFSGFRLGILTVTP
jgi:RHS repeat-associated protein